MDSDLIKFQAERTIPDTFQNLALWQTRRRGFLRAAVVSGAASQLLWLQSCKSEEEANEILTSQQVTILKSVLGLLFPSDGNGPGAEDINAFGYVMWVLRDTLNRKPEDNDFIIEGLDWAEETAQEVYFCSYTECDEEKKSALVDLFTGLNWGETWCAAMIALIFEALLLDPIYGGNTNEAGWKWLNHTAGFPRPTEANRYERIMERQMKMKP